MNKTLKQSILGLGLSLMASSVFAVAGVTVTHTFTNGDVADADEVNTNFSDLASEIDTTNSDVDATEADICAMYKRLDPASLPSYCTADTKKYIFVTSHGHTGNMGGLAGADAICQSYADSSTVLPKGKYKAWLSTAQFSATSHTHPVNRFTQSSVPYYLPDDTTLVANNWGDLVDGSLAAPINKDEHGQNATTHQFGATQYVWTNTTQAGTPVTSDPNYSCYGWTITHTYNGYVGQWSTPASQWTGVTNNSCATLNRLYCVQQ